MEKRYNFSFLCENDIEPQENNQNTPEIILLEEVPEENIDNKKIKFLKNWKVLPTDELSTLGKQLKINLNTNTNLNTF